MHNQSTNLFTPSKIINNCLICLFILATILMMSGLICLPATALLRQHHETLDVLRYHAQDSLKDRQGNTWQVLLFPEPSQGFTTYYLRLVGFPGINSFDHPQPLEIITSKGEVFNVADAYAEFAPAPNVGQYDLTSIIDRLSVTRSLKLSVPLLDNKVLALKIPQEVLSEWRLLTQEIEP